MTRQLHVGVEEPFQPASKAHPAFAVSDVEALSLDPWGNRLEFTGPSRGGPIG